MCPCVYAHTFVLKAVLNPTCLEAPEQCAVCCGSNVLMLLISADTFWLGSLLMITSNVSFGMTQVSAVANRQQAYVTLT